MARIKTTPKARDGRGKVRFTRKPVPPKEPRKQEEPRKQDAAERDEYCPECGSWVATHFQRGIEVPS